jgi:hypothetical protein
MIRPYRVREAIAANMLGHVSNVTFAVALAPIPSFASDR